jgi:hypothetical protein
MYSVSGTGMKEFLGHLWDRLIHPEAQCMSLQLEINIFLACYLY